MYLCSQHRLFVQTCWAKCAYPHSISFPLVLYGISLVTISKQSFSLSISKTHYILRALSSFLSFSFSLQLPLSFLRHVILSVVLPSSCSFSSPRVHYLYKLSLSQSVSHCHILSGLPRVFNFSTCACVCSAGTFFAASRVSPFKEEQQSNNVSLFFHSHPSLFSSFQRINPCNCSSHPLGRVLVPLSFILSCMSFLSPVSSSGCVSFFQTTA